ncbi:MAG: phage major capsid protein [Proteobacteria bacterium]|nr:phage major capsid protein [Pseudomonadota bacterium]
MLTLKQLREKVRSKRAELAEVFKQTKTTDDGETTYDFQKAEADWLGSEVLALEGTAKSMRVVELVNERNTELDGLQDELTKRESAEAAAAANEKALKTPVNRPGFPGQAQPERKRLGEVVTGSDIYKSWLEGNKDGQIELDMGLKELKADFLTTAGWPPESIRTGVVVDAVTRPLQVTDIMPMGNTGMAAVVYMEETTRTHAAAETAEAGTYPESTFELTEKSSTVRKVADSVPVSDEQLEDVAMVGSYLEGRLNFGIQQRLDQQIISGDGIAPNLTGILNTAGIQTNANAGEPVPDTIYNCIVDIQVTGRAQATHVLLHPTDWSAIRLLRTADGIYIWGSPSEQGTPRIWGLPVVSNEVLTVGTGLVGSFLLPWITLFERRGIVIERGFVGTQFAEGMQTIRGSGRWAVVVYRPAAFCTATGL